MSPEFLLTRAEARSLFPDWSVVPLDATLDSRSIRSLEFRRGIIAVPVSAWISYLINRIRPYQVSFESLYLAKKIDLILRKKALMYVQVSQFHKDKMKTSLLYDESLAFLEKKIKALREYR